MKKLFIIVFLAFCFTSFGQVSKELAKGVFVTFPQEPETVMHNNGPTEYKLSNDDYLLAAQIFKNAIPNYSEYEALKKNASAAEIEEFEGGYIDGYIKFSYGDNVEISKFKLGKYFGRNVKIEIQYPEMEVPVKKSLKFVLVNNTMIRLEGGYVYESDLANREINSFLNSLTLK